MHNRNHHQHDHQAPGEHAPHPRKAAHDEAHAGHDKHAGHSVAMFRNKFWLTLLLTIPAVIWSEMRSITQAQGALQELAKLLPDTAVRLDEAGNTREAPVAELKRGDWLLIRPGASIPADGVVKEGSVLYVEHVCETREYRYRTFRFFRKAVLDWACHRRRPYPATTPELHRLGVSRYWAGDAAEQ